MIWRIAKKGTPTEFANFQVCNGKDTLRCSDDRVHAGLVGLQAECNVDLYLFTKAFCEFQ